MPNSSLETVDALVKAERLDTDTVGELKGAGFSDAEIVRAENVRAHFVEKLTEIPGKLDVDEYHMTHRQIANYMYVMYGSDFPRQDPAEVFRDFTDVRASFVKGYRDNGGGRLQLQENTSPAITADQVLAVFAEGEASPRMEQKEKLTALKAALEGAPRDVAEDICETIESLRAQAEAAKATNPTAPTATAPVDPFAAVKVPPTDNAKREAALVLSATLTTTELAALGYSPEGRREFSELILAKNVQPGQVRDLVYIGEQHGVKAEHALALVDGKKVTVDEAVEVIRAGAELSGHDSSIKFEAQMDFETMRDEKAAEERKNPDFISSKLLANFARAFGYIGQSSRGIGDLGELGDEIAEKITAGIEGIRGALGDYRIGAGRAVRVLTEWAREMNKERAGATGERVSMESVVDALTDYIGEMSKPERKAFARGVKVEGLNRGEENVG